MGTVVVSIKFYGKNIEILKFQQPKHSNKNKITDFFPKNHSHFSLNMSTTKKKKVDKPISMNCDGVYYLTFPIKKIKYLKITCKNIRLSLQTLANNNFLLNRFQILA